MVPWPPVTGTRTCPDVVEREGGAPLSSVIKALAGAVVVVLLAACDQGPIAGAATDAQRSPPKVTVARPVVRDITEWDEYTGRFKAVDLVEVRSRVAGHLESVHFRDGQMVEAGQLLFVIDPRPFQIALDRALADVASGTAALELANVELGRAQELLKSDNVARATYDLRVQEKAAAAAQLAIARTEVDRARLDLEYSRIHAPISGRISERLVDVGNLITASNDTGTVLTTIVSVDPIHFEFNISETDYIRYQRLAREGFRPSSRDTANAVWVQIGDETGWDRRGHMDFVDNAIDQSTGTMRGRAIFDNPDGTLTPGQFGRLRVVGSNPYQAILIPETAVMNDQSNKIVLVVKADNVVEQRPVELGPVVDGLQVVRHGVQPEDRIIIKGLLRAKANAPVTPEEGAISERGSEPPRPAG
jgi:RND family efflux transporter MFP subunit